MGSERLVDWWNDNLSIISARVEGEKEDHFSWSQLVWQELSMWESLNKCVSDKELDFMVKRRAFTQFQRDFLVSGLEFLDLRPDLIRRIAGLLGAIQTLGSWGASREVRIAIDGDGADRLKVEGMDDATEGDALFIDEKGQPQRVK